MSRPSSPSSKRSPKAPARTSTASQTPRDTIDVRPSWLEADRAGPPPLQGAAADRDTLEVRPSWIEGDDEARDDEATAERPSATAKEKTKATPKTKARTSLPMRRGRPSLDPTWEPAPNSEPDRSALPPPLPKTEPTDPAPPSKRGKKRS